MPIPELSDQYQAVVLWPALYADAYGDTRVGDPTQIRARWNDKQSEQIDPKGQTVRVDATAVVAQDITVGSRMWLGELTDLVGTSDEPPSDWMQVITFNKTPDLKNRYQQRTAGLMRFRSP